MARDLARAAISTLASASGFDDIEDDTRYFLRKVTLSFVESSVSRAKVTDNAIR